METFIWYNPNKSIVAMSESKDIIAGLNRRIDNLVGWNKEMYENHKDELAKLKTAVHLDQLELDNILDGLRDASYQGLFGNRDLYLKLCKFRVKTFGVRQGDFKNRMEGWGE